MSEVNQINAILAHIRKLGVEVLVALEDETDPIVIGEALTVLADIKNDFKLVYDDTQRKMILAMGPAFEVVVAGKYLRQSSVTPRKKWDHAALKQKVMDRLLQLSIDQETGEVNLTPRETADKLLECAHVDYWRTTALKDLEINPDQYCELGDAKPSIRIEDY